MKEGKHIEENLTEGKYVYTSASDQKKKAKKVFGNRGIRGFYVLK